MNIYSVLGLIQKVLNTIIPIIMTLGLIYFIWGVISYTTGKSDDAKKEGRDRMIYGIIGLFVIVSVWGLVNILQNTFGVSGGGGPRGGLPGVVSDTPSSFFNN